MNLFCVKVEGAIEYKMIHYSSGSVLFRAAFTRGPATAVRVSWSVHKRAAASRGLILVIAGNNAARYSDATMI